MRLTSNRTVMATLAAAMFVTLPLSAMAADGNKEVATAAEHAGLSSQADTLAKAQLHLHHSINCLVGPDGEGFDAQYGNPCSEMGQGALNDVQNMSAERGHRIEDALTLALTGVSLNTQEGVTETAGVVQDLLESD